MTNRPVAATRRQRELAYDMADDFEAAPLHKRVHDALNNDEQLAGLCDAVAETADARVQRERFHGEDAEFIENLEEAWGIIASVVRQRAVEVVADTCVTIQNGDLEEGSWNVEEIQEAKQEAREWAKQHTNEVDRIGRLAEVSE